MTRPSTTVERIAGMNRQRVIVLAAFLPVAIALHYTAVAMPLQVVVIIAAWIVLALGVFPALRAARTQQYLVRLLTLTYAVDITLLTAVYYYIGGGWWMAGAFYAFTIVFASMSAPRSHTLALSAYGILSFSTLLFAQAAGVLPTHPFLGSPSIAGQYEFATATAVVTAVTLILLALLPHTFISIVQRSEQRHDLLLDAANEGVWAVDREGRIEYANPRTAELVGAGDRVLVGRSLFDFVAAADRERLQEAFDRCRRGMREVCECRLRRGESDELSALVSFSPVTEQKGTVEGALVMVSDITERERAEQAVRRSEASSRAFVEHAPYGIYRSSMDGQLLAVNPALVRMLGFVSEAKLMAVNIRNIYVNGRDRDLLAERSLREGRVGPVELAWRRKDDGEAQQRGTAPPVAEDGGDRPARRRGRARLQQSPDRDSREHRFPARRTR